MTELNQNLINKICDDILQDLSLRELATQENWIELYKELYHRYFFESFSSLGFWYYFFKLLDDVNILEAMTQIPKDAFARDTGLKDLEIPSNILKIGPLAFRGAKIESIKIFAREIGLGAFQNCAELKDVFLGKHLYRLGAGCFRNCQNLEEIFYEGTEDDWLHVMKGDYIFQDTPLKRIICSDKVIEML